MFNRSDPVSRKTLPEDAHFSRVGSRARSSASPFRSPEAKAALMLCRYLMQVKLANAGDESYIKGKYRREI